jgi:hypothetical protein
MDTVGTLSVSIMTTLSRRYGYCGYNGHSKEAALVTNKPHARDTSTALVPVREEIVNFYGDSLPAAEGPDGLVYVPIRELVNFMGLDFSAQRRRAMRDRVLAKKLRTVMLVGADGFRRDLLCLPLQALPGWLYGITTGKVRADLVEKIDRYRDECFDVLWNHFKGQIVPVEPAPPTDINPVEQALMLAEAVASLARGQLEYEQRLGVVEGTQRTLADYLRGFMQETRAGHKDLVQRVTALEVYVSGGGTISESQAAELSLHVKTVAHALEAKGLVGATNGYQRVYGELYRRYRIGAYRQLPAVRFDEALAWLQRWYEEVTGEAPPEQGRLF